MSSAKVVAQFVTEYCIKKHKPVTNVMLNKILYFIQAEFLVSKNEPCFPEKILAMPDGPVVPIVFEHYKLWGDDEIASNGVSIDLSIPSFTSLDTGMISLVIDTVLAHTDEELVEIIHNQTPWHDAYYNKTGHGVISNQSLKDFFTERGPRP